MQSSSKFVICGNLYRNDPKFSDIYVWANSADQDQTAPRGAVSQLTNVQSTKSEAAVTVRKKSVSCFTPTCVNTLKTCIFFSLFVVGITVFER